MRNRDMFYQNAWASYNAPYMPIPQGGYNINANTQQYSPNSLPQNSEYEERISKLERQVNNLDIRLQKLETASLDDKTNNFYMI